MAKLRVMFVTQDLGAGGLERVVVTLAKTIDRTQFEPVVLCLRSKGIFEAQLEESGVPVLLIDQPRNGRIDYLSFRKVARLIREQRIDVLHTHNTNALFDGVIGRLLAGGERTVVHTDHARSFPDKLRYMVAEHLLSHFTFKVVGVSEHTTANLRRYEKIPSAKLVTIPNGIDGSAYDNSPIDLAAKRAELGLPPAGPVIGTIARFTPQKAINYLLRAIPELLRSYPTLSLVLAGEGELGKEYRRIVAELGIGDHVHFVGVRTDVPDLLKLFTVFALPSVWEGLPMVILEALAAGCPIVASAVGGVPSAIEHGTNGSLVEPRHPDQLAREIAKLLDDASLRDRYRVEGRRVFQARYSAEAMTRQYEKLYRRQSLES